MTTQLLQGERCYILHAHGSWGYIRAENDGYEGWVDTHQIEPFTGPSFPVSRVTEPFITSDGCILPMGSLRYGADVLPRGWSDGPLPFSRENLLRSARNFLNTPYLWGGRTVFGIDCSGFTQLLYGLYGLPLERDSSAQVRQGQNRELINAQPGDLAFFSSLSGENVSHVGFVTHRGTDGDTGILHASSWVREDTLTAAGIVREDGRLSHRLHSIRDVSGIR